MQFQKLNIILGWLVFAISSVVYLTTIEPTASFWDCGEFIATAYNLEVGHPPGAPFFMILARLFSAFVPAESAAMAVNVLSALSSSFTILFLFWTITAFAKKLATAGGKTLEDGNIIAILGSGLVGALCYTFSDSFWFSAVEGEVYAISSLFTALVFWAIMKWDSEKSGVGSDRWIILIAYLMGLSIGVHLLNLLCIPAIGLMIYLKRGEFSRKGLILTMAVSMLVLIFIQYGIIPGLVKIAGGFEQFFTDSLGTGFNIGLAFFSMLLIALVVLLIRYSHRPTSQIRSGIYATLGVMLIPILANDFLSGTSKGFLFLMATGLSAYVFKFRMPSRVLHLAVMSFTVILIGYSTYAMIVIRSAANPPMDENNPENIFTLLSYLNREQYGDRPLLKGQYWMAPNKYDRRTGQVIATDGDPVYMKSYTVKKGDRTLETFNNRFAAENFVKSNAGSEVVEEYIVSDDRKRSKYEYEDEFVTIFPRMYSSSRNHADAYKRWSNFKGRRTNFPNPKNGKPMVVATFGENLTFFTQYQVNHMYWRYFMWNFAGRQNDQQGHGGITDGNWLSGVKFIDEERLGNQDNLPASIQWNKARNYFFFLPLILGLIGLIYQLVKDTKNWLVIMLLFLLTGLAIVIYLNQYPYQPRERDYAYVGSFYAFAMWVGLGVYALYDAANALRKQDILKILAAIGITTGVIFVFESAGNEHSFSYTLIYMGGIGMGAIAFMWAIGSKIGARNTAILASVLGLVIPSVMAAYGWDDHDRSKRRTAVDIASNYLDSCEEDAILFTNGDNDTFPLWYAQEVEKIRTDVRVVNLSLLNTDWYIDQMKRKAYDSEPVPFTIPEQKYRQGTRDIVLLNPTGNKEPMNLKEALEVALDPKQMFDAGQMGKIPYLPANTFYLDLDAEDLISRGIISRADTARIEKRMQWTIPVGAGYLTKNNLMVLDLIAHNDWNRDVYFAVTTGMDTYLNMQDYFELTGMTYKVTPFKHEKSPDPNRVGGVDTEVMYDNVMNKFKWGNMDTENLYMDENNLRLTTNVRLQLSALAQELIAENKDAKAGEVLDLVFEAMPEENVPLSRVIVSLIESYAKIGDTEKASYYSSKLFDIKEEEFYYYASMEPRFLIQTSSEMDIAMRVAANLEYIARTYEMEDLAKDFRSRTLLIQQELEQVDNRIQLKGRKAGEGKGF
jgi:hypothetical protein